VTFNEVHGGRQIPTQRAQPFQLIAQGTPFAGRDGDKMDAVGFAVGGLLAGEAVGDFP
jgi:hypothetical protein